MATATDHYVVLVPRAVIDDPVELLAWMGNLTPDDFTTPTGAHPLVGCNFGDLGDVEDVDHNGIAHLDTGATIPSATLWDMLTV